MKNIIINLFFDNAPDASPFIHAYAWALVAAIIALMIPVITRNPDTPHSPVQFSWGYLFKDIIVKTLFTLLAMAVCIRFAPDFFGMKLSGFTGVLIGLGNASLANFLKNFGILGGKAKTAK